MLSAVQLILVCLLTVLASFANARVDRCIHPLSAVLIQVLVPETIVGE